MKDLITLLVSQKDSILTITINREHSMNSLNQETLTELKSVFRQIEDDDAIKAIIITGQGSQAFVAGADIKELANANLVNARSIAENGQEIFDLIERFHKPVIAAVNGFALGGGNELAMACHIRIATENAKFGQPEVNLGLIPGYGGTQRLTQIVGKGKAMELILTGDIISAQDALNIGLVNYVVTNQTELISKSEEILAKMTSKGPMALGLAIDCINAVHTSGENGFQTEANSFGRLCGTDDFREGVSAFLEKRKPSFTGK